MDFERDSSIDAFMHKVNKSGGFKTPEIVVDRNYNPFTQERTLEGEKVALTEIYHQNSPIEPSKINLFEDEDFEEDLMRLPNGYWLYNRNGKTLMLDLGRMHRLIVSERNAKKKRSNEKQTLLFSLEYHMNEIEKNKYRSIKKYLPELGFEMILANDNVLRIDAVPYGLKETQVMKFMEQLFEILEYKTEEEFMNFYSNQWVKLNSKSTFDFLYKMDAEQVIKDFTDLGFPEYLPSGKRCFMEIPMDELKNKF